MRWLGFEIGKDERELKVEIADKAWARLEEYLALAHENAGCLPPRSRYDRRLDRPDRGPATRSSGVRMFMSSFGGLGRQAGVRRDSHS